MKKNPIINYVGNRLKTVEEFIADEQTAAYEAEIFARARQYATFSLRINNMEARCSNMLSERELDYFANALVNFHERERYLATVTADKEE